MMLLVKKSKFIVFLLIAINVFSCKKTNDPNEVFNQKYGSQIGAKSGNKKEIKPIDYKNSPQISFEPITQQEVFLENIKRQVQYYPYHDVNKFGQKLSNGSYLNYGTQPFGANGQRHEFSPDIFDIVYEPRSYKTFTYQGAKFDQIRIPIRDKYGVDTSLARKEYLMSGNNALQNSIDLVRKNRTKEDIENSKIIIKEQKALRQKQDMINIFGYDAVVIREEIDNQKKQKIEQDSQELEIKNDLEELTLKEEPILEETTPVPDLKTQELEGKNSKNGEIK